MFYFSKDRNSVKDIMSDMTHKTFVKCVFELLT
jgi:hypothetical protein